MDPADIEDLFDQLEDYSDSGPDADTISIGSTPKPSLKPFFCSSRNLLHEARSVVAAAAVAKAQSEYYSSYLFHHLLNSRYYKGKCSLLLLQSLNQHYTHSFIV